MIRQYLQRLPFGSNVSRSFVTTRHWSISWAKLIHSTPAHPFSDHSNISSHLRLGFPRRLFPSGVPTRTLNAFLFPPKSGEPTAYLFTIYLIKLIVAGEEYILWRSPSLYSFLQPLVIFSFSDLNMFLSTIFSNTIQSCYSPTLRVWISHPYKTTGKITTPLYSTNNKGLPVKCEVYRTINNGFLKTRENCLSLLF